MFPNPDLIKLVHRFRYDFRLISQDASLEVAHAISLHANASTSEIGTPNIRILAIKDLYIEDGKTKKPFLEVLAKLIKKGVAVRLIHAGARTKLQGGL